jgi:Kdo2-lipid IVA lauroyltransferase/acyltransferase
MIMRLLLTLISRVPFAALYVVSSAFYLLNRYVIRYRYDVVRSNLRGAFPDRSESDINALTEQVFRNLADLLVETIKGIGISRDELQRRMTITASSRVQELVDQGTPLIFLTAHYCNWEWLLLYSCIHLPHPLVVAYQPFHNQRFDDFMLETRTRFGGKAVPATQLIREIVKNRKNLKTLTLLADQSPSRNERKYWTTFLNRDTAFIDGTDSLAWLTSMPVVFVHTRRRARGHYDVSLEMLAEPPYEKNTHTIVERYACKLEAMIEADPAAWLWSHRRWKFERPNDD